MTAATGTGEGLGAGRRTPVVCEEELGRRRSFGAPAAFATGAAVLAAATAAMLAGTEPFATWYYVFAWYATLLMLDAAVASRGGRFLFLGRPAFLASLLAWSVPFWLLFELFNFRLENWYYVFVPAERAARWAGITLSFATVLPAIFGAERLLRVCGVAAGGSPNQRLLWPVRPATLRGLQAIGVAALVLPLAWPRLFFPLVWVGVTLIADPFVYRRAPERSLLGDLERGRPGRPVRLLLGGMAIGFLWELFNVAARGKWIYSVPGLEDLKLFEMPLLGFLGFPVFALEGFAAYQALIVTGLAVPARGSSHAGPRLVRNSAGILAAVFAALVLAGMERGTFSSTTLRLADLSDVPAQALTESGHDVFTLARAEPADIRAATGAESRVAERWIELARLALLRGIGGHNAERLRAAGVASVEELAVWDSAPLAARLRATSPGVVYEPRVRVWVRAARDAMP